MASAFCRRGLLIAVAWVILPTSLHGHETRPGYLELRETAPGRYEVLFKVPLKNGARLTMYAGLPESCVELVPMASYRSSSALIERSTVRCEGGLVGATITVHGLEALITEHRRPIIRIAHGADLVHLRLVALHPQIEVLVVP